MIRTAFLKLVLSLVGLAIFLLIVSQKPNQDLGIKPEAKVKIGSQSILVEIVESQEEVEKGLSNRDFLASNAGMLFNFPERAVKSFWMKDMKFPLDIIWIDEGKIVGIEENAPTPSETIPAFTSPQPVNKVLEVTAGFVEKNKVKIGDKVETVK
ncbi:MAG TPA: DUF192 domain-containing protein [Candidatus Nanoarchaeia archaeon]|nr:hypothetical protein [uncultured archaeon]